MLDSHSISSLNDYREIPFPRLIIFYFCFARRVGKRNKYTLLNMPANCPIKYTLLNGHPTEAAKKAVGIKNSPHQDWHGISAILIENESRNLLRCLEFWAYYSYTKNISRCLRAF